MRRMEKKVSATHRNPQGHWVGDGFPVRSLFSYDRLGRQLSPFLLLDYAGPRRFDPAAHPRGVGEHPHRGFETVTIVYRGEVAHRDSAGNGGVIGPGDVQWMTAASGILHEEFHSPEFTRRGGDLEMVQLWVNLPARHKMSAPSYQAIQRADIAEVALADGAGRLRVIAGDCAGTEAPPTRSRRSMSGTARCRRDAPTTLEVPDGHNAAVIVLHGAMSVNQAALGRQRSPNFGVHFDAAQWQPEAVATQREAARWQPRAVGTQGEAAQGQPEAVATQREAARWQPRAVGTQREAARWQPGEVKVGAGCTAVCVPSRRAKIPIR